MFASLYHPYSLPFECMFLGSRWRKTHFGPKLFFFADCSFCRFGGKFWWKLWFRVRKSFAGCDFFDFSRFEKFSFRLVLGIFSVLFVRASCLHACVCVGAILCVGTLVRSCVCTYASRVQRLGSRKRDKFVYYD